MLLLLGILIAAGLMSQAGVTFLTILLFVFVIMPVIFLVGFVFVGFLEQNSIHFNLLTLIGGGVFGGAYGLTQAAKKSHATTKREEMLNSIFLPK